MSYAIGVAQPTSISLNTFGTGKLGDDKIIALVREHFDLRPTRSPACSTCCTRCIAPPPPTATSAAPYEMTVGADTFTAFTWEKTDKADALRAAAGL